MIKVSVIGATGYVGAELMRLLANHPKTSVVAAISKNFAGKNLSEVYPNFSNDEDVLLSADDAKTIAEKSDVVFLCLPHGQSMQVAPALLENNCKVIDLSGDFRYNNLDLYEKWYGLTHTAKEENTQAVYGLPEFFKDDIANTNLLANPGCYTTASILALAPLLKNGLIKSEGIIIDAKSGVSGAGRKESLGFSYCETHDNFKAYSVVAHRHTSEIEEQLGLLSKNTPILQFSPHLLPVKRGILATIYADINEGSDAKEVYEAYSKCYENATFTHVLQPGNLPELKQVVGSNNCYIGFDVSTRTKKIIIVSCIDNLIKGAAGQAIHNFNIMNGLEEGLGLPSVAWYL